MEIRIPEIGESVREALLAKWFRQHGDLVRKDEPLCEIETDKITLDLNAETAGVLSISVAGGTMVKIGAVIGAVDESGSVAVTPRAEAAVSLAERLTAPPSSPSLRSQMREYGIEPDTIEGSGKAGRITQDDLRARIDDMVKLPPASRPAVVVTPPAVMPEPLISSSVQRIAAVASGTDAPVVFEPPERLYVRSEEPPAYAGDREERRAMSPIRRRIAERLVAVRLQTAMLTTFNEADMSRVHSIRQASRETYLQRYGFPLGYMPFFVKACVEALKEYPVVNASIDGDDIVYHRYYDIGVAIGSEKGLVVPVLRSADCLKPHEIEAAITAYSDKIRTNHLSIQDLSGGTFTISNGGVYGSLLSTPILNPPQSAVLGMHAIQERPVVRDGQIVARPMMYLALSYDHRIIDGREAVGFLKKIRECIEAPEELIKSEA